jgi:hypothetical protein
MMKNLAVVGVFVLAGCAAGTALIKTPVEQKCAGYGLKGCGELVDGVVAYVEGDKDAAVLDLKRGAAKNSPEQIRPFAGAIKEVVPGEAGAEIAEILSGDVHATAVTVVAAAATSTNASQTTVEASSANPYRPSRQPGEALAIDHGDVITLLAIGAPVDPSRLLTGTASPSWEELRVQCEVLGKQGICSRQQAGPIVVTDAAVPAGCPSEMFVGAADESDGRTSWLVQANAPGVHGAKFFVRSDQRLMFAIRAVSAASTTDPRCVVTWAGFKPRIVPLAIAPASE